MSKKSSYRTRHILTPGHKINLDKSPTDGKEFTSDREKAEKEFKILRRELMEWQRRLYAEDKRSLLVVLQAMDAGGKDGAIRHVFRGVNPQGVRVTSFKVPSDEERSHDFLWRVHQAAPPAGTIGVFNRSHYEDVIVVRVEQLVPPAVWGKRFDHINHFEELLTDSGTTVVKFYLHISRAEQQKRFRERLTLPHKNWKFALADLNKARHWNAYMEAFDDVLERCTTEVAPWYVIPANQKWYRNLAVVGVLVETLRDMNPAFPSIETPLRDEDID